MVEYMRRHGQEAMEDLNLADSRCGSTFHPVLQPLCWGLDVLHSRQIVTGLSGSISEFL